MGFFCETSNILNNEVSLEKKELQISVFSKNEELKEKGNKEKKDKENKEKENKEKELQNREQKIKLREDSLFEKQNKFYIEKEKQAKVFESEKA